MEYYKVLQDHYESKLQAFGPNHKGMDWPNESDLKSRFEVLTNIVKNHPVKNHHIKLLDLGCGVGLLIDFLKEKQIDPNIEYTGIDISSEMVKTAQSLYPDYTFKQQDILKDPLPPESFDFIIMNGLLTEKQQMTQDQMIHFASQIISNAFRSASVGIAFNVMSSHVDWKRDDLFHWELDNLVNYLVKNCSRRIHINMDYGLYEYTVHLLK